MLELSKIKAFFTNYSGVIFGFVLLSFGFDFINKIELFYGLGIIKLSRILKALFLVYSIVFIMLHYKYVYKHLKVLSIVILTLSIVFFLKNNFSERYVSEYVRYIFVLLSFPLLHYAFVDKDKNLLNKLYKLFKWLVLINAILILISALFELRIFNTYYRGRFGFNGIILSQGFIPFFYLTATTLFWALKDKKMLLLVLLLSILSGVKGVYFGVCLLLGLLVILNHKYSKSFKIKVLGLLAIAFIGLLMGLFLTPIFKEVIESNSLLTAIFSFRIENTITLLNHINLDNYNLLIGTLSLKQVRLEMQISDIILFFGLIGLFAYIIFFYFLQKSLVKDSISKAFFISTLVLSALSGNLLYIPMSSILMFLVLIALYNKSIK